MSNLYSQIMPLVLAAYFAGTLLSLAQIILRRRALVITRRVLVAIAALAHLIALAAFARGVGQHFLASIEGSSLLFSWLLVIGLLLFEERLKLQTVGVFITFIAFLVGLYAYGCPRAIASPVSALDTWWLKAHVPLLIAAFACFALAACASIVYLIQDRCVKEKRTIRILRKWPPLPVAERLIVYFSLTGLLLLTLGILMAAIGGHAVKSSYKPEYDPKVIFSMLLWFLYAGYLLSRRWFGWRGRKSSLLNLLNFFVTLVTFFVQHRVPETLVR